MDASLPLNVKQLCFVLKHYLPRIGAGEYVDALKVDAQSDTEHTITVGTSGIGIDTGYAVHVQSLNGVVARDGYRVFVIHVHPGGRYHPPEEEDVTTLENLCMMSAVEEVGRLLAKQAADNLPDFPDELVEEQAVAEEVF